jgi:hypothetical protein
MRTEQRLWTNEDGWSIAKEGGLGADARAVLVFGSRAVLKQGRLLDEVREFYPKAHVIGCSSAGEIAGTCVLDDSLVVTAARFEHAQLRFAKTELSGMGDSFEAGVRIASSLLGKDLIHVVVFSDGLHVNGSELAKGLREKLPLDVAVTGGLAGDGSAFEKTLVLLDDKPKESMIAAIGFYGSALQIGYGSMGGWTSFGQDRLVTRAKGNVLYELDGRSALDLYKEYLGDHAKGLPATGLLFPLSIRDATGQHGLVRTILAIDENEGSMTFAGDIPEHTYVRLMKASIDGLVDGASEAAVARWARMQRPLRFWSAASGENLC